MAIIKKFIAFIQISMKIKPYKIAALAIFFPGKKL